MSNVKEVGMATNPGFQISLNLQGRLCAVIGGEDEASHKTSLLLKSGAKVVVVNPTLNVPLRKLTASGAVLHRGRRFRSSDTQGVFMVLNTLAHEPDLAQSLRALADAERFLVWSIDQPELSNVMMPAVVQRGALRVAISTSGTAPALASVLRQDCEKIFDEEFEKFVDWLCVVREDVQANEPGMEKRNARLKAVVDGFRLTGNIEYPQAWIAHKQSSDS